MGAAQTKGGRAAAVVMGVGRDEFQALSMEAKDSFVQKAIQGEGKVRQCMR